MRIKLVQICAVHVRHAKKSRKSEPYRKLVEQKKAELKSLIDHGATDVAIGAELGMTVSRVKYWIKEWNLGRRKHIIATGGSDNKQGGELYAGTTVCRESY